MPEYKHHVFLSYDHRDYENMKLVRNCLVANDLHVWMDENIKPGTTWSKKIASALDECGCMVVIFTEHTLESKGVSKEVDYAYSNDILMIPVIFSGDPTKSLILNSTQYIDATDFDSAAPQLLHAIRDHLDLETIIEPDTEYNIVVLSKNNFPTTTTDKYEKYDKLGKRTKQVLMYISEYKAKYDRAPSVREISEKVGLKSTDTAQYHINKLRHAGFLERGEKLARSKSIVRPVAKYDIFLSYGRADKEIAEQIWNYLLSKDLEVCTTESAGPVFTRLARIQEEIRNSRCMISILSPRAKPSIKVLTHLICAQETQTPIIPLLISGNPLDAIPPTLPSHNYYDMRGNFTSELEIFSDSLMRYLGRLI